MANMFQYFRGGPAPAVDLVEQGPPEDEEQGELQELEADEWDSEPKGTELAQGEQEQPRLRERSEQEQPRLRERSEHAVGFPSRELVTRPGLSGLSTRAGNPSLQPLDEPQDGILTGGALVGIPGEQLGVLQRGVIERIVFEQLSHSGDVQTERFAISTPVVGEARLREEVNQIIVAFANSSNAPLVVSENAAPLRNKNQISVRRPRDEGLDRVDRRKELRRAFELRDQELIEELEEQRLYGPEKCGSRPLDARRDDQRLRDLEEFEEDQRLRGLEDQRLRGPEKQRLRGPEKFGRGPMACSVPPTLKSRYGQPRQTKTSGRKAPPSFDMVAESGLRSTATTTRPYSFYDEQAEEEEKVPLHFYSANKAPEEFYYPQFPQGLPVPGQTSTLPGEVKKGVNEPSSLEVLKIWKNHADYEAEGWTPGTQSLENYVDSMNQFLDEVFPASELEEDSRGRFILLGLPSKIRGANSKRQFQIHVEAERSSLVAKFGKHYPHGELLRNTLKAYSRNVEARYSSEAGLRGIYHANPYTRVEHTVGQYFDLFFAEFTNCKGSVSEERALEILRDNSCGELCEKLCTGDSTMNSLGKVREYVNGIKMKEVISTNNRLRAGLGPSGPLHPPPTGWTPPPPSHNPAPVLPPVLPSNPHGGGRRTPRNFNNIGEETEIEPLLNYNTFGNTPAPAGSSNYVDSTGRRAPFHPKYPNRQFGVRPDHIAALKGTNEVFVPRPKWNPRKKGGEGGWDFYQGNDFGVTNPFWTPLGSVAAKFRGTLHPEFDKQHDVSSTGSIECRFCKNHPAQAPHIVKECWKVYSVECGFTLPKKGAGKGA
jgi:hypothetical protein